MEIHFTDKFDEGQYDRVITVGGDGADTTVATSVAIFDDEGLRTRVNVLSNAGASCFQDVRCIASLVFIGFGRYVFILDAKAGEVTGHRLDGYFGRIYDGSDFENLPTKFSILVTSASEALAFSRTGELLWIRENLGIDGVLLHAADSRQFDGEGDWDPPGGWRKFSVLADTGTVL
ncbi:hypothetical protein [Duganella vulcania]|uniref:Uncharacterized protein n=1 Tax=Duganella vulcania TaxID=2692166 RepID=A0A845GMU0_9BURK|nr:hypothetical protein [Duganella vulcania]MYM94458.1 hypothetical protein [Duganella vulcania]